MQKRLDEDEGEIHYQKSKLNQKYDVIDDNWTKLRKIIKRLRMIFNLKKKSKQVSEQVKKMNNELPNLS